MPTGAEEGSGRPCDDRSIDVTARLSAQYLFYFLRLGAILQSDIFIFKHCAPKPAQLPPTIGMYWGSAPIKFPYNSQFCTIIACLSTNYLRWCGVVSTGLSTWQNMNKFKNFVKKPLVRYHQNASNRFQPHCTLFGWAQLVPPLSHGRWLDEK